MSEYIDVLPTNSLMDGPYEEARLTINRKTGIVTLEEYLTESKLHRPERDGPAWISRYDTTGLIHMEHYFWHGLRHRENGPAIIEREEDGEIIAEHYYRYGKLHRDPSVGPAIDMHLPNGRPYSASYYLYGKKYRDPKDGPCVTHYNLHTNEYEHEFMTAEEAADVPQAPEGFWQRTTPRGPSSG